MTSEDKKLKKRSRLKQIELWLKEHYPPPIPVVVRVEHIAAVRNKGTAKEEKNLGETYKHKGKFIVRISKTLHTAEAIDTLIHEWGHVRFWDPSVEGFHSDDFWQAHGEIYRKYHDAGGDDESRKYKVKQ